MCIGGPSVRTPTPQPVKEKDPVYMRNPYLDGLGIGAESTGRNSLRIDRGSAVPNSESPFLGIDPNPRPSVPGGSFRQHRYGGGGLGIGR